MRIATTLLILALAGPGTAGSALAGSPAARLGDPTSHGGVITGPGSPNVLIGDMPAARLGDHASCPLFCSPFVPHVGGPIAVGSPTVLINGLPAARVGDVITEVCVPSTPIVGDPTVLIGP